MGMGIQKWNSKVHVRAHMANKFIISYSYMFCVHLIDICEYQILFLQRIDIEFIHKKVLYIDFKSLNTSRHLDVECMT